MKQLFVHRAGRMWALFAALSTLLAACDLAAPATAGPPKTAQSQTIERVPAVATPIFLTALASPVEDAPAAPTVASSSEAVPPAPAAAGYPAPAPLLPAVSPLPPIELAFNGERAYQHLTEYMQFQPRNTGSPGWKRAGDYIVAQMQAAGWKVEEQRFEYKGVTGRNIIAKQGAGPVLIVGAHYDGRKYADKDPDPAKQQHPMPGANDGGSGVAVLLELARHIDTERLGREVWLTFFDAEDNGNLEGWEYAVGSAHMAQNLDRKPEAMILLDLIGDADLDIFFEWNSTLELSESIWRTAAELGYPHFVPQIKHSVIDDHTAFLQAGIPAVDLIDFDYPHWDTTNDTLDKVSAESLEVVGRTMERWLETRAHP